MLFSCKTNSWFDVWSIEHIVAGICLGYFVKTIRENFLKGENNKVKIEVILLLLFSFIWETLEHYLETGLLGSKVEQWFYGVEFWGNRLITDQVCIIFGYILYRKIRYITIPARVFSLSWLFIHIFIFPHSMYLHKNCASF